MQAAETTGVRASASRALARAVRALSAGDDEACEALDSIEALRALTVQPAPWEPATPPCGGSAAWVQALDVEGVQCWVTLVGPGGDEGRCRARAREIRPGRYEVTTQDATALRVPTPPGAALRVRLEASHRQRTQLLVDGTCTMPQRTSFMGAPGVLVVMTAGENGEARDYCFLDVVESQERGRLVVGTSVWITLPEA